MILTIESLEACFIDKEFVHYSSEHYAYDGVARVKLEKNESFIDAVVNQKINLKIWHKLVNR